MTNKEEWRDIQGYEGLYQISNSGKVKSLIKLIDWEDCKRNLDTLE